MICGKHQRNPGRKKQIRNHLRNYATASAGNGTFSLSHSHCLTVAVATYDLTDSSPRLSSSSAFGVLITNLRHCLRNIGMSLEIRESYGALLKQWHENVVTKPILSSPRFHQARRGVYCHYRPSPLFSLRLFAILCFFVMKIQSGECAPADPNDPTTAAIAVVFRPSGCVSYRTSCTGPVLVSNNGGRVDTVFYIQPRTQISIALVNVR